MEEDVEYREPKNRKGYNNYYFNSKLGLYVERTSKYIKWFVIKEIV